MMLAREGWFGIETFPAGYAVEYVVLWLLLVVSLAKNPEWIFPEEASLGVEAERIWNSAGRRFGSSVGTLMVWWALFAASLRARNADGIGLDERYLRISTPRFASRTGS